MEKDHFHDRSYQGRQRELINIGDYVFICEKHMQKTAERLEDLTCGKVIAILTSKPYHPRGIKVKIITTGGREAIGRIVYLVKDYKILRS